jgi:hypothetical protein
LLIYSAISLTVIYVGLNAANLAHPAHPAHPALAHPALAHPAQLLAEKDKLIIYN